MSKTHPTMRDNGGALAAYRQAARLNPWSPPALKRLAPLEAQAGRVWPAIRAYERYMHLDPNYDPFMLFELAKLYEQAGCIDAAFNALKDLSAWQKACASLPPYFWTIGARVLAHRGQIDRAIQEFNAILQQDPAYGLAFAFYADALIEAGRYDEAEAAVRAGLAQAPDDPKLREVQGKLDAVRGRQLQFPPPAPAGATMQPMRPPP